MEKQLILKELTTIFRTIFEEPTLIIQDSMSARDVEKWDSMNYMRLLSAIENRFGFKFKFQDLSKMKNVGEIISTIESRII